MILFVPSELYFLHMACDMVIEKKVPQIKVKNL